MAQDLDQQIAVDLAFLAPRLLGVLRFGSSVDPRRKPHDIDLCLVAPGQSSNDLLHDAWSRIDVCGKHYDVWVFEELPIWMRHEVIRNHVVTWSANTPALYEYLYHHRKLCEDMVQRQRKAM